MKMKVVKSVSGLLTIFLVFTVVTIVNGQEPEKIQAKMPANVKSIIENSCYGCHNADSRNDDAKEELDFKNFHELNTFKKVGTLRDIGEVLEKGEMPPKKFLERFPDRKPTEEEVEILTSWVKQEAEKIIGDQ